MYIGIALTCISKGDVNVATSSLKNMVNMVNMVNLFLFIYLVHRI